jgi:hypothetical protein
VLFAVQLVHLSALSLKKTRSYYSNEQQYIIHWRKEPVERTQYNHCTVIVKSESK